MYYKNGIQIAELTSKIICDETDIKTLINMKRVMSDKPLILNVHATDYAGPIGFVNVRSIEEGATGGICKVELPAISTVDGDELTLAYHKEIYTNEKGDRIYPPFFRILSYNKKGE